MEAILRLQSHWHEIQFILYYDQKHEIDLILQKVDIPAKRDVYYTDLCD